STLFLLGPTCITMASVAPTFPRSVEVTRTSFAHLTQSPSLPMSATYSKMPSLGALISIERSTRVTQKPPMSTGRVHADHIGERGTVKPENGCPGIDAGRDAFENI